MGSFDVEFLGGWAHAKALMAPYVDRGRLLHVYRKAADQSAQHIAARFM